MTNTYVRFVLRNVAVCFAICVLFPAAGRCNSVVNGDFSGGTTGYVFTGNVGVFTSAQYVACCASGDTGTGNFVAFGGGDGADNGQITQTIATVAGKEYSLSFLYGAFSSPSGIGTQSVTISAGDLNTTLTSGLGSRDLSQVFAPYQYYFMAAGGTTTLSFSDASTNTSSRDGLLDSIDVEQVTTPEPSSLLLLGTGVLGLAGFCRRYRHS